MDVERARLLRAQGYTYREIAVDQGVSLKTAHKHLNKRPHLAIVPDAKPSSALPPAVLQDSGVAETIRAGCAHAAQALPKPHAAMLRLNVDAVLGRRHVEAVEHAHFLAEGDQGTGKSTVGRCVLWVLGLPRIGHEHRFASLRAGQIAGRIVAAKGEWKPSPLMAKDYLVINEISKPNSTQATSEFFGVVDSSGLEEREGQVFEWRPTIYATSNLTDRFDADGWGRRFFKMTAAQHPDRDAVRRLLREKRAALDLGSIPAVDVPDQVFANLEAALEDELTEDAYLMTSLPALPELVTGRSMWSGLAPEDAAIAILCDLVALAETRGELQSQQQRARAEQAANVAELISEDLQEAREAAILRLDRIRREAAEFGGALDDIGGGAIRRVALLRQATTRQELADQLARAGVWAQGTAEPSITRYRQFMEPPRAPVIDAQYREVLPGGAEEDEDEPPEPKWEQWLANEYGLDDDQLDQIADLREQGLERVEVEELLADRLNRMAAPQADPRVQRGIDAGRSLSATFAAGFRNPTPALPSWGATPSAPRFVGAPQPSNSRRGIGGRAIYGKGVGSGPTRQELQQEYLQTLIRRGRRA